MNAHQDHPNDGVEDQRGAANGAWPLDQARTNELESEALDALARSWQTAPPLQVDPTFAAHLERRLLAHRTAPQRRHAARWWGVLPGPWRTRPILTRALGCCLLMILLLAGVLVAASQVTTPNNPLYAIKHWEQQVQVSLVGSAADQTELDLQSARDHLNLLSSLTDDAHAEGYRQALAEFEHQLQGASEALTRVPVGPDHDRLAGELAALQRDARHTLRSLLLRVAVTEGQVTTDELARLGDTVPHVTQADLTLPAHPHEQALVSIRGEHLQPGAQLLVNGRVVPATGTFQPGQELFQAEWNGKQHPHSLGIVNPDGTVAQTTTILLHEDALDAGKNGKNGENTTGNHTDGDGQKSGNQKNDKGGKL